MLGGFSVHKDARPLALPPSSQRVVALVALKRQAVHRLWVSSTLWPYSPPEKAAASLRSALWRLRPLGAAPLVQVEPQYLALADHVEVDWYAAVKLTAELLREGPRRTADPVLITNLLPLLRAGDLLEGWKDEWCTEERGRYRSMRTTALDVLSPNAERQVGHHPGGSFRSSHRLRSGPDDSGPQDSDDRGER